MSQEKAEVPKGAALLRDASSQLCVSNYSPCFTASHGSAYEQQAYSRRFWHSFLTTVRLGFISEAVTSPPELCT